MPSFLQENIPVATSVAVKQATESVTESTTLQNDDELSLYVEAGEKWIIEYDLSTTFDTDAQIKVAVTVPSTSTLDVTSKMFSDGLAPSAKSSSTSGEAMDMTIATATAGQIFMRAIVTVVATGFVNLQWAQVTSDVADTAILAGSTLKATKI
jgi:hypothetical protein